MPSETETDQPVDAVRLRRRRWGGLCRRFLLSLLVLVFSAKAGDWLLGVLADSERRHLLRLEPSAEVVHSSDEFDYVFRTNPLGFRGRHVDVSARVTDQRLVVLGDSFVAGVGVADDEVFTEIIAEKVADRSVDVVNLGRAGTSTVRESTIYEQVGRAYRGDVVMLVYYLGNDLAEVVDEKTDEEWMGWRPRGLLRRLAFGWCPNMYMELAIWKRRARALDGEGPRSEAEVVGWIRREALSSRFDPAVAEKRYRALPRAIRDKAQSGGLPAYRYLQACLDPDRLRNSVDPDAAFEARAWDRTRRHLEKIRTAVVSDGGRFVLAVIPDASQVSSEAHEFQQQLGFSVHEHWLEEKGRTLELLKEWSSETGTALLNLAPAFRDHGDPTFHIEDGHCNAAGHRVIAASVLAWPPIRESLGLDRETSP